jgi:hypothetical protein
MSDSPRILAGTCALAAALFCTAAWAAPTLTFSNSPGNYPGSLVHAGGATALATGVPIEVFGPGLASLGFAMTTAAATAATWTFPAGGGVTMTNNMTTAVLFTGTLGVTTVTLSPEEPGSITGFKWAARGTFVVTDLDDAYEASQGLATDSIYDGDFWFGFNDPISTTSANPIPLVVGQAFDRQVGWRVIHLVAREAQAERLPEPPVWAMAALAALGLAAGRRRVSAR